MIVFRYIVLPVLVGGVIYAIITAAVVRAIPKYLARTKWVVALCWLIGLSVALLCWFTLEDAKAAAAHRRNVGMAVVFIWAWLTIVLPAPIIGTVLLRLFRKWLRTDTR